MEKQKDDTLLKARGYRNILATGFRLYTGNFRRLFKASWQMALLYAIACGCLGTLSAIKIPELTVAIMQQIATYQGVFIEPLLQYAYSLLAIVGLLLLAIATLTLASATILNKLREHKETGAITTPLHWLTASPRLMGRTLKGTLLTLLLLLVPLLLFIGAMTLADALSPQFTMRHLATVMATFAVATVIVLLMALPLNYTLMKYLMEAPCGYWRTLRSHYSRGLRYWGSLLLVNFVSLLLVTIAYYVVTLPAGILQLAHQSAQQGLLMGDPLGMPSYMTPLTFVTITLTSFIGFYVTQVTMVHNYYAYGSIEAREKERNENTTA